MCDWKEWGSTQEIHSMWQTPATVAGAYRHVLEAVEAALPFVKCSVTAIYAMHE